MSALKFAFRTLFKAPFVTVVAILSLALGIGANTAIFTLFNQMLLRPLPVADPFALVNLGAPGPKPGSQSCGNAGGCDLVFSYPMFRDLEKAQTVFTGIAAHVGFGGAFAYNNETRTGDGVLVSGSYFPVLGLIPAAGRLFTPADDQPPGEPHVVVLSHDYWRTRFGQSPDAVGKTMVINGQPMAIVGVAPEGFTGTTTGQRPDVFVPISMRGIMNQAAVKQFENRRSYWAYLFARRKPGVTLEQARASLDTQYRAIINDVEAPLQTGMSEQTLTRFRAKSVTLEAGQRGQSSVHEEAGTPLLMLFSLTGVVLLIACANIANLLLARSASRSKEMAVRLSIGASRRQLIGQLLLESCLLALMGGAAGLLVARLTLRFIQAMLPAEAVPVIAGGLDTTVLGFALLLSVGTGVLFGLFPAFHSTRPNLALTLKNQAGQPAGARSASWFRWALVTAQVFFSTALLLLAGLFTRSLVNVSRVDLGIDIENLVTFAVAPRLNGYTDERSRRFFEELETQLAAIPGAIGVGASRVPVIAGSNWGTSVGVQGFAAGPDTDVHSHYSEVGPGFFRTVGFTMLAGREFTPADADKSPKVAVVNEAFAKKFNLGSDAVGRRMQRGGGPTAKQVMDIEIVGLVKNAKYSEVKQEIPPVFYLPYRQDAEVGELHFYVRSGLPTDAMLQAIRAVVKKLDPNLPIGDLRTMAQQVRENVFLDRMVSTLTAAFAALATVLAAIGLYGVLAYNVSQRTREFGLRMALGAAPSHVRGIVLRQVGWMTAIGGVLGIAAAILAGRAMGALLYNLEPYDPIAILVSVAELGIVALGAGLLPAVRASRIDPMKALRYE
jgi:predicted permease